MTKRKFTMRIPARAKITPWIKPYHNGRPAFIQPAPTPGLYVIRNRARRVVYVGYSGYNVKKTAYRHFQDWDEANHHHATYDRDAGFTIRFLLGVPNNRIHDLERHLVHHLKPKDNAMRYSKLPLVATVDFDLADLNRILNHPIDNDLPF